MWLSRRERYIVIAALVAVGALAADRYVLTPLLDWQAQLDADRQRLLADLDRATALFARQQQLAQKWREMLAAGLQARPDEVESRVLHAVRDWSQSSGLVLSSLKPEASTTHHGLEAVTFRATGAGPMQAVAGFLWRVQTASIPVKITELQIGSRKTGQDDLTLQIQLSALCLAPAGKPEAGPAKGRSGQERRP